MDIGKWKIIALSLVLLGAIAVPVFAYKYHYLWFAAPTTITSGVKVVTWNYPEPTLQLGIYWDVACTQPVTSFDFGEIVEPNVYTDLEKVIYLRNEGDNWVDIFWNSTLHSATTEITEGWCVQYPWVGLNGSRIWNPGEVGMTWYFIRIPPYATAGTFNWTLTVWGQHEVFY